MSDKTIMWGCFIIVVLYGYTMMFMCRRLKKRVLEWAEVFAEREKGGGDAVD